MSTNLKQMLAALGTEAQIEAVYNAYEIRLTIDQINALSTIEPLSQEMLDLIRQLSLNSQALGATTGVRMAVNETLEKLQ